MSPSSKFAEYFELNRTPCRSWPTLSYVLAFSPVPPLLQDQWAMKTCLAHSHILHKAWGGVAPKNGGKTGEDSGGEKDLLTYMWECLASYRLSYQVHGFTEPSFFKFLHICYIFNVRCMKISKTKPCFLRGSKSNRRNIYRVITKYNEYCVLIVLGK